MNKCVLHEAFQHFSLFEKQFLWCFLVKGFTLLDADKCFNLYNCRVEKKMRQTKTQSHTHLLRKCFLHWEMTLWPLIYHLGDVLVYIRASRLDPVIRVCKSNHTFLCVTANKQMSHIFSLLYNRKKWKDHLWSWRDFSHITKIESCQCMCAPRSAWTKCRRFSAQHLGSITHHTDNITLLSTNHQA